MTAWVLLLTVGTSVFTVPSIATLADCDQLATAIAQTTSQELNHVCISYEQASAISEVHIVGPTAGNRPPPPPPPQFHLKKQGGKP